MNWKNICFGNDKGQEEYCSAIEQAMVTCSEPISGNQDNLEFALDGLTVEARGKVDTMVVKFRDGRSMQFDMLLRG